MAVVADAEAGLGAGERGATAVLLRMPGAAGAALEREARRLVAGTPLPVLVSSRVDVALAVAAAGVNLPERDIPVAAARALLGPRRLLGRSVHSLEAAVAAEREGADFVILGPVYETPSHPGRPGIGPAAVRRVATSVRIPVIAIGGVDPARAAECRRAGAAGYAGIRAFA